MKRLVITALFLAIGLSIQAQNQRVEEKIDITISSSELSNMNGFTIQNINGDLKVEGYDGNEIRVSGSKVIKKRRGRLDDETVESIFLEHQSHQGIMYMYVRTPGSEVNFKNGKLNHKMNWDKRKWDKYDEIGFQFDIVVKVPNKLLLRASTVNGSQLIVEGMNMDLNVSNVNGDVMVRDAKKAVNANTVNGDIEIWYDNAPTTSSDFNTVNGSIQIYSPENLSAVVTFKSLHGDLYTDFDEVTRLPNKLNKAKGSKGYRVSKTAPIQIGQGGPTLAFETLNGDAYIQKRKSK
ncbi:DUF4097 family beta strand repeat-containing protein [Balneola vulgaris]|uniref:DUF4097 family beta strand repeat-containing protein n=1 Tax=Balneola vulgaris TaxID=287535 RepID=UPI00036B7695|nr:hypothetical protein [Balneola vulgaris]